MAKTENEASKTQRPGSAPAGPPVAAATLPGSSRSTFPRWFFSRTVRHATAMRKHVRKLLNHQRDILAPQAIAAIQKAAGELQAAIASNADKAALEKQMENLEAAANKWLKPYPNAAWR